MKYTKAIEQDHTEWTLTEFIRLHGKFSKIHEYDTDKWYGQFNNKGIHTITCVAKAVRNIPINDMIDNSDKYSVVVLGTMYCVCQTWEDVELGDTDHHDEKSLAFEDFIKNYDTLEASSCYYPIRDGGEKCILLKNIWREEVIVFNLNCLTLADIIKHTKELYVIKGSCGYELEGYIPEKKVEEASDVWDFVGKVDEDYGKVYSIVRIQDNACMIVYETLPVPYDKYYSWEKHEQKVLPNYYEKEINENCSFVYKYYGFGLGIKRDEHLVLPCNYSFITNPINGWCFAIGRYSFVPGLTKWDTYYVLLWNIEKHTHYEFIPPTDYIVAADKLCKDEVKTLLSDGAFRLYIVGEDETSLKSFAIQKKYENIFLQSFLNLLHSPIDVKRYIPSTYWISKDNVEDAIHPHPKEIDEDPWKDYDFINDALDGDPDAYWNID